MFRKNKQDTRHLQKTCFDEAKLKVLNDDELEQLQKTILDIFKDFLKVAEKNNIHYVMGGGSALGTARHHGFIPWDDDIDINMSRKDFNKLNLIFDEQLGDKYVLCAPERGRMHGVAHVQIKKKGTIYQSFNELSQKDIGIGFDIFVYENTPNNKVLRNLHGLLCLAYGYLLTCRKTYEDMPKIKKYIRDNDAAKIVFGRKEKIGRFFKFLSLDKLAKRTVHIYSMCKNDQSKFVTIPTGRKHYFGEMYPRNYFSETVDMQFEDIIVKMPKEYHQYLVNLYGENYMDIPPDKDHEQHPIIQLKFDSAE